MEGSLDVQNLLQTGYFKTSRARNTHITEPQPQAPSPSPSPSPRVSTANKHVLRSPDRRSPSRRPYPPPPSVEDEATSLLKEYGTPNTSSASDEEPQSRGDIEQHPIIMEVHEHNPERRFVILNEMPHEDSEAEPPEVKLPRSPAPEHNAPSKVETGGKHEEKPRFDATNPSLQRRRSRQDLPPLETDVRPNRPPQHQRSRSSVSASRPDYFSPRQSRPYGDQLLSPEIIQSGLGGREKAYRGLGPSPTPRSPRQSHVEISDRRRDDEYHRRRQADSMSRRSESSYEAAKPSRRMSGEWTSESRNRKDHSSSRSERREDLQAYARSNGERVKTSPSRASLQSHSSGEHAKESHPYLGTQDKPIVVQAGRPPGASSDRDANGTRTARSQSRTNTAPLPSPSQAAFATGAAIAAGAASMAPRTSATFLVDGERKRPEGPRPQLPYPDDDDHIGLGIGDGDVAPGQAAPRPISMVSMPLPSPVLPSTSERLPDGTKAASPAATSSATPGPWQVPSFDPERDGLRADAGRPVGSYRRFSESKETEGTVRLPECPRVKPAAGLVDWLTLPRTDVNICPTCYESVFAKSEFRTQFQPMLRPTGDSIACDFGSSAWYRIAWLLTEKHETPDLRLFYKIASVMASSRAETCPGNRKAARNWLTIKDPYTKRPVPEFSVCYECARTVEALLPNLTGVFVPLEARSEPTKDVCALHFTPKRKQFVLFFDALETTSDRALVANQAPNIADLTRDLQQISIGGECREDSPVHEGYWHVMQFLPQFTVCSACFDEVVRPKLGEGNTIVRNFYMEPQKLPSGTCQLYSPRMREIFHKACRRRDPGYLKEKVLERRHIEAEIFGKLLQLDRTRRNDAWTEEQVEKLVREWKRWE